MIKMKRCDRCKGEGRIKLPEYDLNNPIEYWSTRLDQLSYIPIPITWEEPNPCGVCGGEGWLKVI